MNINNEYHTQVDGEFVRVPAFDECIKGIVERNKSQVARIQYLEKENAELKATQYKDEELQRMKKEIEKLQKRVMNGFLLSEEQSKMIKEWEAQHIKEFHTYNGQPTKIGLCGGNFTYTFLPTSIGTFLTVKCGCGKGGKLEISDL